MPGAAGFIKQMSDPTFSIQIKMLKLDAEMSYPYKEGKIIGPHSLSLVRKGWPIILTLLP